MEADKKTGELRLDRKTVDSTWWNIFKSALSPNNIIDQIWYGLFI